MNAFPAEPSAHDREDAALLTAVAERRDRTAFEKLYARYEMRAYSLALHLTGNADRAAEAVQEALLRVWTHAPNFRVDGNARGWILRIVARESLRTARQHRAESAEECHEMESQSQGARAVGAARLAQDEELAVLRCSLERLPEAYRRILALYYGAGMSQREIGVELCVSQRTVSSRLDEAIKRLRSMLTHAGVAAAVPLLGTETLHTAISTGHEPPVGLGEATLARLSDASAQQGQVSRALSREGAAAGGSSVLWIAGALALAAAATGGGWALQEPGTPKVVTVPAAALDAKTKSKTEAAIVAPLVEEPRVLGHWTFEKGAPKDLEIVRGGWTWQAPKDGKPGAMHAPGRVWVIAPLTMPEKLPVRVVFRFAPLDRSAQFNFSAYRTDGTEITGRTIWSRRDMSMKARESFTIQEYLIGRYTIGMFLDERMVFGADYENAPLKRKLCLAFVNMDIQEIEVRALAPDEMPRNLRDPKAVIEHLGVKPEIAVGKPIRGEE